MNAAGADPLLRQVAIGATARPGSYVPLGACIDQAHASITRTSTAPVAPLFAEIVSPASAVVHPTAWFPRWTAVHGAKLTNDESPGKSPVTVWMSAYEVPTRNTTGNVAGTVPKFLTQDCG